MKVFSAFSDKGDCDTLIIVAATSINEAYYVAKHDESVGPILESICPVEQLKWKEDRQLTCHCSAPKVLYFV